MSSAVFGLFLAIAIGMVSVKLTTVHAASYFDLLGLLIVIGGTVSVAAISYNVKDLFQHSLRILRIFSKSEIDPRKVIVQIIDLAKANNQSHTSSFGLRENKDLHPFVNDGLRYIDNQFSEEEIADIMNRAVLERKEEYSREIDMVSTIAKYPPAFGMIGTVIGLIALMYGLGDEGATSRIGPNMAVALTTTLYGLVVSNYLFTPIADNLLNRMKKEMHVRRIIIRGIIMLSRRDDPVIVQETLNAFLMPRDRIDTNTIGRKTNRTKQAGAA